VNPALLQKREHVLLTRVSRRGGMRNGKTCWRRRRGHECHGARDRPQFGPICRPDGSIIAEPLFWFRDAEGSVACLEEQPTQYVREELEDAGGRVVLPGESVS